MLSADKNIRLIAAYALCGDDMSPEWAAKYDTADELTEDEKAYDKWFQRSFANARTGETNDASTTIYAYISSAQQAAYEDGIKAGARLIVGLLYGPDITDTTQNEA